MDIKNSVAYSQSGKLLKAISVTFLLVGILLSIIFICFSFGDYGFNWTAFTTALMIFFVSLLFFAVGKTIASIANHVEAIYKIMNPEAHLDEVLGEGAEFIPGDKVIEIGNEKKGSMKVTNVYKNEHGFLRYECVSENGESKAYMSSDLRKV